MCLRQNSLPNGPREFFINISAVYVQKTTFVSVSVSSKTDICKWALFWLATLYWASFKKSHFLKRQWKYAGEWVFIQFSLQNIPAKLKRKMESKQEKRHKNQAKCSAKKQNVYIVFTVAILSSFYINLISGKNWAHQYEILNIFSENLVPGKEPSPNLWSQFSFDPLSALKWSNLQINHEIQKKNKAIYSHAHIYTHTRTQV